MYENERKERGRNNSDQGCVLGLVRAILGLVRATGTSDFLCQHTCWIRACQGRSSSCAGELERLDLLAPASPATCYFADAKVYSISKIPKEPPKEPFEVFLIPILG